MMCGKWCVCLVIALLPLVSARVSFYPNGGSFAAAADVVLISEDTLYYHIESAAEGQSQATPASLRAVGTRVPPHTYIRILPSILPQRVVAVAESTSLTLSDVAVSQNYQVSSGKVYPPTLSTSQPPYYLTLSAPVPRGLLLTITVTSVGGAQQTLTMHSGQQVSDGFHMAWSATDVYYILGGNASQCFRLSQDRPPLTPPTPSPRGLGTTLSSSLLFTVNTPLADLKASEVQRAIASFLNAPDEAVVVISIRDSCAVEGCVGSWAKASLVQVGVYGVGSASSQQLTQKVLAELEGRAGLYSALQLVVDSQIRICKGSGGYVCDESDSCSILEHPGVLAMIILLVFALFALLGLALLHCSNQSVKTVRRAYKVPSHSAVPSSTESERPDHGEATVQPSALCQMHSVDNFAYHPRPHPHHHPHHHHQHHHQPQHHPQEGFGAFRAESVDGLRMPFPAQRSSRQTSEESHCVPAAFAPPRTTTPKRSAHATGKTTPTAIKSKAATARPPSVVEPRQSSSMTRSWSNSSLSRRDVVNRPPTESEADAEYVEPVEGGNVQIVNSQYDHHEGYEDAYGDALDVEYTSTPQRRDYDHPQFSSPQYHEESPMSPSYRPPADTGRHNPVDEAFPTPHRNHDAGLRRTFTRRYDMAPAP